MSEDIPDIPPYRPSFPASINPAEFIALRTIVMSMVCVMAAEFERASGQPAQVLINNLAIISTEAISKADITATDGRDMEGIRSEAIEQINNILGGIRFPRKSDKRIDCSICTPHGNENGTASRKLQPSTISMDYVLVLPL